MSVRLGSTFGVIADDLTGGMDTGVQFAKTGLDTLLVSDSGWKDIRTQASQATVLVINTDSRTDPPKVAYHKVREAAELMVDRRVYKKIDSTLRGNLGSEVDAILDELELKKVLVAPAFPDGGRTVMNGNLLVDGRSLSKAGFAPHLGLPDVEHIPSLLRSQTKRKVAHFDADFLEGDVQAIIESIQGESSEILVFDTHSNLHLQTLGVVLAKLGSNYLGCGSAGFANAFACQFASLAMGMKHITMLSRKSVLLVAGSRHEKTLTQVEKLRTRQDVMVWQYEPRCTEKKLGQYLNEAVASLHEGRHVLLLTPLTSFQHGESLKITADLGNLAAQIARSGEVGLVLTGGDTASAVCHALGIKVIHILDELLPGVPIGVSEGGEHHGIPLITKAGGFGSEDILSIAIKQLTGETNV